MPSVSFERSSKEWKTSGKAAKEHKLKFEKDTGPHNIEFLIGTPTGRYEFDLSDPIWVKADDGNCPTQKGSHPDIKVVEKKATRLVIENSNDQKAMLRYQLNVIDTEDGDRPCPIDPIIDNGGKGRKLKTKKPKS